MWCGPLRGEPTTRYRADEQHYAASTMKLALVMAAYRGSESGQLDLDQQVTVHNTFASRHDGSPFAVARDEDSDPEPWRRLGEPVALRWLCHRAIVRSSNLATNLVLDAVGTDAVADVLAVVGATRSRVTRGIEDGAARAAGLQNVVTAADLARTLQALTADNSAAVLSPVGSLEVLAVLAAQQINDAMPARLPAGTVVAHKSGWVDGISHDAGIVYPGSDAEGDPFVFAMCTTSELAERAGLDLIATTAAAAFADRRL